jgi:hypothetical protein
VQKYSSTCLLILTAAALLTPQGASAQSATDRSEPVETARAAQQNVPPKAQEAEDKVERVVRRFRIGFSGGVGLDPEIIDFGAHATFGPIFNDNVQFRPGIEFGVGEVTTLFGINLDVIYTLPGANRQTRWSPYVGAGPNFALSHRGFSANTTDSQGNRFDFGDTNFDAGFNFIAGARNRSGLFIEMKATAYGVSNVRLLAGYTF